MAVFNAAKREIDIKIVYYGPALCGKTTNVQCIHNKLSPDQRGDIMSLATKDDRTLFFDFLPIELGNIKGFKTRFHIYTVPGQVYYSLTRRAVLTGIDGIIFVADSQNNKMEENTESLKDLVENLKYYKKDLTTVPLIFQYNKRDLDNILSVEELNDSLNMLSVPYFEASAIQGTGIVETLTECCKLVLKQMNRSSEKKKSPQQPLQSMSEGDNESFEPIIKITSEDIPATQDQCLSSEAQNSENTPQQPSVESLSLEEPKISHTMEPEIKIDSSDISSDTNESAIPAEEISLQEDIPSLKFENEQEDISVSEPEISLDPPSVEIQDEPEISLDSPSVEIQNEPEISLDSPSVEIQNEPEISLDSPSVEIQDEPETGFRIISCGHPQKDSNTSIKIPIIFKIDQVEGECMVNLCITFDDFKLKR